MFPPGQVMNDKDVLNKSDLRRKMAATSIKTLHKTL